MRRIIALHGWLDNCASFDQIAARLNADVLCLDLAGHGQSGYRQHLGAYNVWLDLPEILAVADQMEWPTFELLGHSRGAAIAFVLSATFAKRVERLVCLDGIFPLVAPASKAPDQLYHSINSVKKQLAKSRSYYPTFEQAVQARQNGMFPLSERDAHALARRAVIETQNGYTWQYDPKATAPSELRFTPEQLMAFARALATPVDLIIAEGGIIHGNQEIQRVLKHFVEWRVITLPGGHHFHMSEQAESIANIINSVSGGMA
ncbi:MAG TPA: alpha/beta hydrolase [Marinagarivorans sp.]